MRIKYGSAVIAALAVMCFCLSSAVAADGVKRTLKGDMTDFRESSHRIQRYQDDPEHLISKGAASFLLGCSRVSDDADLVTPWRGFPTNGYTRAMGQYNWYAGTETVMLQAGYDFSKAGLVPGLSVKAKYAVQDFDNEKPDVPADSKVLNIDFLETVGALPGLLFKLRTCLVSGDSDTVDMNGDTKADPSCNELRLEMNYLF